MDCRSWYLRGKLQREVTIGGTNGQMTILVAWSNWLSKYDERDVRIASTLFLHFPIQLQSATHMVIWLYSRTSISPYKIDPQIV